MVITKDQPRSRRGLLAGALGGLAAVGGKRAAAAEDATDANDVHKGRRPDQRTDVRHVQRSHVDPGDLDGRGSKKSGVFAYAAGTNSRGVTGLGVTGVIGQSNAATGRGSGANAIGVFGDAASASGAPVGALGRSKSPNGIGVIGRNLATTGDALGVLGDSKTPPVTACTARTTSRPARPWEWPGSCPVRTASASSAATSAPWRAPLRPA
jgi:hypothetical protein